MKLSKIIEYVNKALNYPALTLNDIDIYIDMALAELNTTLHTSLLPLHSQIDIFKHYLSKKAVVTITSSPNTDWATGSSRYKTVVPSVHEDDYFFNTSDNCFYIYAINAYSNVGKSLKGIYSTADDVKEYETQFFAGQVHWIEHYEDATEEYDFEECLPYDWILLWLIPYICFKYTVKDGGTAQTFADELQQGFQQLQETYSVPEYVSLASVADKLLYRPLVEEFLPKMNINVGVRAIYNNMKHSRSVNAIYGSMYDNGGFYNDTQEWK